MLSALALIYWVSILFGCPMASVITKEAKLRNKFLRRKIYGKPRKKKW